LTAGKPLYDIAYEEMITRHLCSEISLSGCYSKSHINELYLLPVVLLVIGIATSMTELGISFPNPNPANVSLLTTEAGPDTCPPTYIF